MKNGKDKEASIMMNTVEMKEVVAKEVRKDVERYLSARYEDKESVRIEARAKIKLAFQLKIIDVQLLELYLEQFM